MHALTGRLRASKESCARAWGAKCREKRISALGSHRCKRLRRPNLGSGGRRDEGACCCKRFEGAGEGARVGAGETGMGAGDGAIAVLLLGCCTFSKARKGSSNAMSMPPAPRRTVSNCAVNPGRSRARRARAAGGRARAGRSRGRPASHCWTRSRDIPRTFSSSCMSWNGRSMQMRRASIKETPGSSRISLSSSVLMFTRRRRARGAGPSAPGSPLASSISTIVRRAAQPRAFCGRARVRARTRPHSQCAPRVCGCAAMRATALPASPVPGSVACVSSPARRGNTT
jgi:hypothetical protein